MTQWRKDHPTYYIDAKKSSYARFYTLKQTQPCLDCNKRYPYFILEYDHRDPKTKFRNVSELVTCSPEALSSEIAKCDLVCANCHHMRTASRRPVRQTRTYHWDMYIILKSTAPCVDCVKVYPAAVMEFDHRDPTTKIMQVSRLTNYPLDKLKAEISKCDILCRNCHRLRTHKMFDCKADCMCHTFRP